MTKSNKAALVYFEDKKAGLLKKTNDGYEFSYDKNYLHSPDARAISVSLPLREEPYQSKTLFPFFDGLLREGWLLDITSSALNIDKRDKFSLLLHSGEDAIGAVSIRPIREDSVE